MVMRAAERKMPKTLKGLSNLHWRQLGLANVSYGTDSWNQSTFSYRQQRRSFSFLNKRGICGTCIQPLFQKSYLRNTTFPGHFQQVRGNAKMRVLFSNHGIADKT